MTKEEINEAAFEHYKQMILLKVLSGEISQERSKILIQQAKIMFGL